jgi:hypothetical protein
VHVTGKTLIARGVFEKYIQDLSQGNIEYLDRPIQDLLLMEGYAECATSSIHARRQRRLAEKSRKRYYRIAPPLSNLRGDRPSSLPRVKILQLECQSQKHNA